MVEAYKHHRLDVADADATTVNNELKILRMFGRWLVRRANLPGNPFEYVKDVIDEGAPRGRCLRVDEHRAFVTSAEVELRDWALVTGLHGLRRGETDHLRPEDISIDGGYMNICKHRNAKGEILWRPKFGKERRVPFVETVLPLLKALQSRPTDKQGHLMGIHDRRKARDRTAIAAGIEGHVRFHDFRHTAYTQLKGAFVERLDPEIALAEMRRIFGHSSGSMDEVYDHRSIERMRSVISLSPLLAAVADVLAAA